MGRHPKEESCFSDRVAGAAKKQNYPAYGEMARGNYSKLWQKLPADKIVAGNSSKLRYRYPGKDTS